MNTRPTFLPFSPPDLTDEEIDSVVDTLRSGWITRGPKTKQFEEAFAKAVQAETALGLNSCTAGLHLALVTLGIGPGDEVIVPSLTFCSSVNVIEHVGATPVLVDIDPRSMTLDPQWVEGAITPRTKAIMPVHFAGHPAAMSPLQHLAEQHGLALIEDAAHAMSGKYKGQAIGSIGDLTAFSFYATKNLTTGEGGMLSGKAALIEKARVLSLHGMSRDSWNRYGAGGSWYYEVTAPGFKYNMTDIQAALGIVQLKRLADMQARRRAVVVQYHAALAEVDGLEIPLAHPDVEHSWHLYVIRLPKGVDRGQFIEAMHAHNIGTSVHFIPVHVHPYYRDKYGWPPTAFPQTWDTYQRCVSLPLHSRLTDADVQDVIGAVKACCGFDSSF